MAYDSSLARLPDPTTNPVGPGWATQTLRSVSSEMSTAMNSAFDVVVYQGGDYWEITLNYNALPITEFNQIFPFLTSLKGKFTKFYVQLPNIVNPASGAWTGTGAALGQGNIIQDSASSIVIASASSLGGSLAVGDYVKLSNSDKIYLVTSHDYDGVLDQLSLGFHCEIEKDTDALTYLEPNDIKFRVNLQSEMPSYQLNGDGIVQPITLTLKEQVSE